MIVATLEVEVAALSDRLLRVACPFALRRRGVETRIIAGEVLPAPDAVLQRSLAEAHDWARALRAGASLTKIARETGRSERLCCANQLTAGLPLIPDRLIPRPL